MKLDKQKLIEDFVKSFKTKLKEENRNRTGRISGEEAAEYLKIHGSDSELFGDKFVPEEGVIWKDGDLCFALNGSVDWDEWEKIAERLKKIFHFHPRYIETSYKKGMNLGIIYPYDFVWFEKDGDPIKTYM